MADETGNCSNDVRRHDRGRNLRDPAVVVGSDAWWLSAVDYWARVVSVEMNWYVVHAYSGFENQVKRSLEDRVDRSGMNAKYVQILVPTEEVVEMKEGQKRKSDRKFFPGYVLVDMTMDNDSWHLVKNCP